MFTFSTPCLKWKLLAAIKYQYGVPGFAAPYATRYLSMLATVTTGFTGGGPTKTASQAFTFDRISGAQTPGTTKTRLVICPYFPTART